MEGILALLGDVVADPQSYVDDIATMLMDESGLREACPRISQALEEILLRSHPDKTEVVISGRSKKAEMVRENVESDPPLMQSRWRHQECIWG